MTGHELALDFYSQVCVLLIVHKSAAFPLNRHDLLAMGGNAVSPFIEREEYDRKSMIIYESSLSNALASESCSQL